MQRREFLSAALATAGIAAMETTGEASGAPDRNAKREYYELRLYTFASEPSQQRFESHMEKALVPALKRLGHGPVGVFTEKDKPENLSVYVLIPHPTLESFASLGHRLETDAEYKTAGAEVLNLHAADPPYARIESWLLLAFEGYPKLHVPAEVAAGKGRTFELRTYESHSEKAGKKKIEMFNAGEIGIFERGGFQPVFFGETVLGSGMPNLTYMVTYADGTERADYWTKFMGDPEKTRLFAMPEYADKEIVSKIHAVFLRPTAFSQI